MSPIQPAPERFAGIDPSLPVHRLIADQVAVFPDRPAVSDEQGTWTYAALWEKVETLAARLAQEGVRPGDRVGIHTRRGRHLIASVLATLRVGAAYVPLPPELPEDRRGYMLGDARPSLVLHTQESPVPGACASPTIDVDAELGAPDQPAAERAPSPPHLPENVAYIIYTSGSTGRPKGAMVKQQGLSNILQYCREALEFGPQDSLLAVASFSFDFSVLETLVPLVSGGTLHMLDHTLPRDPERLLAEVESRGTTVMMGTPSLFTTLSALGWKPPERVCVVAGGEALPAETANRLGSARQIWNIYGPTETSIFSTCERVGPGEVTIGTPVSHTTVRIMDGATDVGDGPGEICISGVGVGAGYVNLPELTEQRFTVDPYDPQQRMYRTGDRGQRLPDGRIRYLGRADDQVKIRGHRIELGGVEATVRHLPEVDEAAVVVEEGPGGQKQLVAYVVTSAGTDALSSSVRRQLQEVLPAHEVPQRIHVLDSLPRNTNGKIDRLRLKGSGADLQEQVAPPRTSVESAIVEIWKDALGLSAVGVDSDFFEIGGDSLAAMRVSARARRSGLEIPARLLYEHPTIALLAEQVSNTPAPVVTSRPETSSEVFPLLPAQHRFFTWQFDNPSHYNEPLIFSLRPGVDRDALQRAVRRLVERHEALRSRICEDRSGFVLGPPEQAAELAWHDLSGLTEEESARRFRAECEVMHQSIDIFAGPMMRAAHFHIDAGDRLILILHHLVCDGVALHTLTEDLCSLYHEEAGQRTETMPLPHSVTAYARELQEFAAATPQHAADISAWRELPWPSVKPLPDYSNGREGSLESGNVIQVEAQLNSSDTARFLQVNRRSTHTSEEVLVSAVAQAVAEFSASEAVAMDVVRHGRITSLSTHDIGRTVGWLASAAPFVVKVGAGEPSEVLSRVSDQVRSIQRIEETWGPLRHLHTDPRVRDALAELGAPEVYLNFRGPRMHDLPAVDPFERIYADTGRMRTETHPQPYPLEIRVDVDSDLLSFGWKFSKERNSTAEIEHLASRCVDLLRSLLSAL